MSAAESLIRIDAVVKSFDAVSEPVLRGVDLSIERGESIAILGPSGSGKSTLLHVLGTLEPPTSGRVLWEGEDVSSWDLDALARFRNEKIGFVFQHHYLLPQCSAFENVLVPTLPAGKTIDRGAVEARARELLERVGLGARLTHRPAQLSGGERQRVAVVRALINEPELVLADEPTGSLDEDSADGLGELLVELNREHGVALVVVTHSRRLGERMGRVLELRAGKLGAVGSAPDPVR